MEHYHEASKTLGNLLRQSPENEQPADPGDKRLLPVDKLGSSNSPRAGALIPSELFGSDAGFDASDPQSRSIYLEACRRSLNFQMEQYLRYVGKVRAAGIEPKDLIKGLGKMLPLF
jgi:hypothetical protein